MDLCRALHRDNPDLQRHSGSGKITRAELPSPAVNRASDTPSARDYTIRVSRRAKYMQLRLTRDGTLEVVLPEGAPLHPVPAFVQAHRNWITRARARHGQRQRRLEDLRLELPEHLSLPGLGEEWALTWNQMLGLLPRIRIIAPGQLEGLADTAAPAAAQ